MKVISVFISIMIGLSFLKAEEVNAIPKNSVYQIKSEWLNQENKKIHLSDFMGKLVIIGMVYTGCEHACPLTISRIQDIEKKIKAKGAKNYQIVLASFDTKNDRPSHLKEYMIKRKLDSTHWSMLAADHDETVRELSIVLGINYKKIDDTDFSHSNVLTLLNEKGVSLDRLEGLNSDTENFINNIVKQHAK